MQPVFQASITAAIGAFLFGHLQDHIGHVRAMEQASGVTSADIFVSWLSLYHDMGLIGACMGSLYIGFRLVLMSPLAFPPLGRGPLIKHVERAALSDIGIARNPEITTRLFDGDWLNTGDLGYLAAGELYLTGREKDIIIRGGHNIQPHELGEAISQIRGVCKGGVAVFPSTDERTSTEKLVVLAEINNLAVDLIGMLDAGCCRSAWEGSCTLSAG